MINMPWQWSLQNRRRRASAGRFMLANTHALSPPLQARLSLSSWQSLTKAADIDWRCVEMFHLDEYIGLPMSHPASFHAGFSRND